MKDQGKPETPSKARKTMDGFLPPNGGRRPYVVTVIVNATVLLAVGGFLLAQVTTLDRRVSVIESNRYTSKDGARDKEMIVNEIRAMERMVSDHNHPDSGWIAGRIDKIDQKLEKIQADVTELKTKVK